MTQQKPQFLSSNAFRDHFIMGIHSRTTNKTIQLCHRILRTFHRLYSVTWKPLKAEQQTAKGCFWTNLQVWQLLYCCDDNLILRFDLLSGLLLVVCVLIWTVRAEGILYLKCTLSMHNNLHNNGLLCKLQFSLNSLISSFGLLAVKKIYLYCTDR